MWRESGIHIFFFFLVFWATAVLLVRGYMRAALSRLAYLGGTARTCEVTFSLGVRKKGIGCANAMFRLLPRNCASGVGFATGAAILRCCAGSGEETRVRGGGVTPTPLSCSSEWARPAWLEVVGRSESGRPVFLFFFPSSPSVFCSSWGERGGVLAVFAISRARKSFTTFGVLRGPDLSVPVFPIGAAAFILGVFSPEAVLRPHSRAAIQRALNALGRTPKLVSSFPFCSVCFVLFVPPSLPPLCVCV